MQRRPTERAGRRQLPVGPRHRIVESEDLPYPIPQPPVVGVEGCEAPDVDGSEVARRLPFDDPVGQRPSRAAPRRDTDRIEPCPDEEAPEPGRLAQDELIVGREALRTVEQLLETGLLQHGDPMDGGLHQHAEVIPILLQELELEREGQRIGGDPRLGLRLEAPHDEAADLLLDVGVPVGVAQNRQVRVHRPQWLRSPRRSARPSGGARRPRRGGRRPWPTDRRSSRRLLPRWPPGP